MVVHNPYPLVKHPSLLAQLGEEPPDKAGDPWLYAVVIVIAVFVLAYLRATRDPIYCDCCGKKCNGRIAGGTMDKPICGLCVQKT
jgi:hypothetical protein